MTIRKLSHLAVALIFLLTTAGPVPALAQTAAPIGRIGIDPNLAAAASTAPRPPTADGEGLLVPGVVRAPAGGVTGAGTFGAIPIPSRPGALPPSVSGTATVYPVEGLVRPPLVYTPPAADPTPAPFLSPWALQPQPAAQPVFQQQEPVQPTVVVQPVAANPYITEAGEPQMQQPPAPEEPLWNYGANQSPVQPAPASGGAWADGPADAANQALLEALTAGAAVGAAADDAAADVGNGAGWWNQAPEAAGEPSAEDPRDVPVENDAELAAAGAAAAQEAKDRADQDLRDEIDRIEDDLEDQLDTNEGETERRRRHGDRGRDADRKRRLDAKRDRLNDRASDLSERQSELDGQREDFERTDQDLRNQERELRQNDPNCRSQACQDVKRQQAENQHDRYDTMKQQAELDGDWRDYERDQREYRNAWRELQEDLDNGNALTPREKYVRRLDRERQELNDEWSDVSEQMRRMDANRDDWTARDRQRYRELEQRKKALMEQQGEYYEELDEQKTILKETQGGFFGNTDPDYGADLAAPSNHELQSRAHDLRGALDDISEAKGMIGRAGEQPSPRGHDRRYQRERERIAGNLSDARAQVDEARSQYDAGLEERKAEYERINRELEGLGHAPQANAGRIAELAREKEQLAAADAAQRAHLENVRDRASAAWDQAEKDQDDLDRLAPLATADAVSRAVRDYNHSLGESVDADGKVVPEVLTGKLADLSQGLAELEQADAELTQAAAASAAGAALGGALGANPQLLLGLAAAQSKRKEALDGLRHDGFVVEPPAAQPPAADGEPPADASAPEAAAPSEPAGYAITARNPLVPAFAAGVRHAIELAQMAHPEADVPAAPEPPTSVVVSEPELEAETVAEAAPEPPQAVEGWPSLDLSVRYDYSDALFDFAEGESAVEPAQPAPEELPFQLGFRWDLGSQWQVSPYAYVSPVVDDDEGVTPPDPRLGYDARIRDDVLPAFTDAPQGREFLPAFLGGLADGIGARVADKLVSDALTEIEALELPHSPELFVDRVLVGLAWHHRTNGDAALGDAADRARIVLLAGVLGAPEPPEGGPELAPKLRAALERSLDEFVEARRAGASRALDDAVRDRNASLQAIAELLDLSGLPSAKAPQLAPIATALETQLGNLELGAGTGDPQADAAALGNVVAGLEGALGALRSGRLSDALAGLERRLVETLARSNALLANAYGALANAVEGDAADTARAQAAQARLAQAAALLQIGQVGDSWKAVQSLPAGVQRDRGVVGLVDQVESVYTQLNASQRGGLPTLAALRNARDTALEEVLDASNDPQEIAGITTRLGLRRAAEGDRDGAIASFEKGLAQAPGDPVLGGQLLGLELAGIETPSPADVEGLLEDLAPESRPGAAVVALQGMAANGDAAGFAAVAGVLEKLSPADPQAADNLKLQVSLGRLELAGNTTSGDPLAAENAVRQQVVEVRAALAAAADGLAPAYVAELNQALDAVGQQLDQVAEWRTALAAETPPAEGFAGIARQALASGTPDVAALALRRQSQWLASEQNGLPWEDVITGFRDVVRQLEGVRAALEQGSLTQAQRSGLELVLHSGQVASTHLDALADSLVAQAARAGAREGVSRSEADEVRLRQVGRLQAQAATLWAPADGRAPALADLYRQAEARADAQLARTRARSRDKGEQLESEGSDRSRFLGDRAHYGALLALADGIKDLYVDTQPVHSVDLRDGYGFLPPTTGRAVALRDKQRAITGVSIGQTTLQSDNDRARGIHNQGARANISRADNVLEGEEANALLEQMLARDELAYLERRRQQLVFEDPGLSPEARVSLYQQLLQNDADVERDRVGPSNAFSELSQRLSGFGDHERMIADLQESLIDASAQRALLDAFDEALVAGDAQAAFRALAQLREASIAGEIDAFVQYTDVSWADAGPARAYNLWVGMEATQESLEQIALREGAVAAALVRASYRLPDQLSQADQDLLTRHGFITDGAYSIPASLKVDVTRVGTDFVDATQSGVLGAVDKALNAKQGAVLVASVAVPGAIAGQLGRGVTAGLLARFGTARVGVALAYGAGSVAEATAFTGLSRGAQVLMNPAMAAQGELWTANALGTEFLHNLMVIGALKVFGAVVTSPTARGFEKLGYESAVARDVAEAATLLPEAAVLWGLSGVTGSSPLSQASYVENVLTLVALKGANQLPGLAGSSLPRPGARGRTEAPEPGVLDTAEGPAANGPARGTRGGGSHRQAFELYESLRGSTKAASRALREGRITRAQFDEFQALHADVTAALPQVARAAAARLRKPGQAATGLQIEFVKAHPNFIRTLHRGVLDLIRKAAFEHDNPAAQALLADLAAKGFKIRYEPSLESLGAFSKPKQGGPPVLRVNPFFRHARITNGESRVRTLDDIASSLLHEYTHMLGHGELRAFEEQYTFLRQVGRAEAAKYERAIEDGIAREKDPLLAELEFVEHVEGLYRPHYMGELGLSAELTGRLIQGALSRTAPIRPMVEAGRVELVPEGMRDLNADANAARPERIGAAASAAEAFADRAAAAELVRDASIAQATANWRLAQRIRERQTAELDLVRDPADSQAVAGLKQAARDSFAFAEDQLNRRILEQVSSANRIRKIYGYIERWRGVDTQTGRKNLAFWEAQRASHEAKLVALDAKIQGYLARMQTVADGLARRLRPTPTVELAVVDNLTALHSNHGRFELQRQLYEKLVRKSEALEEQLAAEQASGDAEAVARLEALIERNRSLQRDISKQVGGLASVDAVKEMLRNADPIFQDQVGGGGAGEVDYVWRAGDRIVVVEAKGGSATVGVARVGFGDVAEQGTLEHTLTTALKMASRGLRLSQDPATLAEGQRLLDGAHAIFEGYANGTLEIYVMSTRWDVGPTTVSLMPTVIQRARVQLATEAAELTGASAVQ